MPLSSLQCNRVRDSTLQKTRIARSPGPIRNQELTRKKEAMSEMKTNATPMQICHKGGRYTNNAEYEGSKQASHKWHVTVSSKSIYGSMITSLVLDSYALDCSTSDTPRQSHRYNPTRETSHHSTPHCASGENHDVVHLLRRVLCCTSPTAGHILRDSV